MLGFFSPLSESIYEECNRSPKLPSVMAISGHFLFFDGNPPTGLVSFSPLRNPSIFLWGASRPSFLRRTNGHLGLFIRSFHTVSTSMVGTPFSCSVLPASKLSFLFRLSIGRETVKRGLFSRILICTEFPPMLFLICAGFSLLARTTSS